MATEREIFLAIREHFPKQEYALLPQVRNSTGIATRTRTADAIAFSLWPSRGIFAHGFEFKDSRADWVKELKSPEKAEEIGRFCSRWSVVISDEKIASLDEIPPAWGLMLLSDGKIKVLKKAPHRDAQSPSVEFVGAILRAAQDVVTGEDEINRQVQTAIIKSNEGHYKELERCREMGRKDGARELDELRATVRKFEQESGVTLGHWDCVDIGKAVRVVRELGDLIPQWAEMISRKCEEVKKLADEIRGAELCCENEREAA